MKVAARGYGASKVAVTDVRSDNLPIAKQLGVDVALLTPRDMTPEDIAAALRAELPPFGPDVVIDCAGFDSTLQVRRWASCGLCSSSVLRSWRYE